MRLQALEVVSSHRCLGMLNRDLMVSFICVVSEGICCFQQLNWNWVFRRHIPPFFFQVRWQSCLAFGVELFKAAHCTIPNWGAAGVQARWGPILIYLPFVKESLFLFRGNKSTVGGKNSSGNNSPILDLIS